MKKWQKEVGKKRMKIGVLALQGAVDEHIKKIENLGHDGILIKKADQLDHLDGLILPGGESTTIGKLINIYGFTEALTNFSKQQKPIYGTCAGLILLAREVNNSNNNYLGLMDIKAERNAFGRQRESFEADINIKGVGENYRAVFIRAPYILSVKENVEVLASYDNKIVAARQDHLLCCAFHPELTEDSRMHTYFLNMVKEKKKCIN